MSKTIVKPARLIVEDDVLVSGPDQFLVTGWDPILPEARIVLSLVDLRTNEYFDQEVRWNAEYTVEAPDGGDAE